MDKLTVKFELLERIVRFLRRDGAQPDTEVSFEFLVGSCFPNALENIKLALREEYTKGYLDGLKENQNEEQSYNNIADSISDSSDL